MQADVEVFSYCDGVSRRSFLQIGSLALRSGNGVILKGGSEATLSNRALVGCLRDALEAEQATEEYQEKLEAREQRERERAARAKDRPTPRAKPKKKGCAPDDPLCGLDLD